MSKIDTCVYSVVHDKKRKCIRSIDCVVPVFKKDCEGCPLYKARKENASK